MSTTFIGLVLAIVQKTIGKCNSLAATRTLKSFWKSMPVSIEQKLRFQKAFEAAIKKAANRQEIAMDGVWKILKDYRLQIVDIITGSTGWDAYWAVQMRDAIDRASANLASALRNDISGKIDESWEQGREIILEPLQQAGSPTPNIGLSLADLSLSKDLAADLVTDVSRQAAKNIARQIQLAILGGKTQTDVVKELGRIVIGDEARKWRARSVFKTVVERSNVIYRTETMRTLNSGHYAQALASAQEYPNLRKYWMANNDARSRRIKQGGIEILYHVEVDTQTNPAHGGKPIPYSEDFTVLGEKGSMPLDPRFSAKNVVRCRCRLGTTLLNDNELADFYEKKA